MAYPILKIIVLPLVKLLIKEVKGIENIPKKGPFIVTSNHSSFLDPLLLGYYIIKKTNQKIHFIAYRGRFAFLGKFIIKKWLGVILLRYNKKEISVALEEAVSILKKEGIVGIFLAPEPNYSLAKPKTGIARIALDAKCPVLPVILRGVKESTFPHSIILRRIRHASVIYKKPLVFKKTGKNIKSVANKIARVILLGLKQNENMHSLR